MTMRISITFLLILYSVIPLVAQIPESINYQMTVRDQSNQLITNQSISLQFSFIQGHINGPVVYTENHFVMTNSHGLVALKMGNGTPMLGTYADISWPLHNYFVQIGLDINGGTSFTSMGKSQLVTVPYAEVARNVLNNNDADADSTNEIQLLTIDNDTIKLSNGGGSIRISIYSAGNNIDISPNGVISNTAPDQVVTLSGSGSTIVSGVYPNYTIHSNDSIDDLDNDPHNELQEITRVGDSLSLSNQAGGISLRDFHDADFYALGSLSPPSNIEDTLFTLGALGINIDTPKATLDVMGSIYFEGGHGDVNNDGNVNFQDLFEVYDHLQNNQSISRGQQAVADVNGDGKITLEDVYIIYDLFNGVSKQDALKSAGLIYGSHPSKSTFLVNNHLLIGTPGTAYANLDVHGTVVTDGSLGDVNQDGIVDQTDVNIIYDYITINSIPSRSQIGLADLNGDGFINFDDIGIAQLITSGFSKDSAMLLIGGTYGAENDSTLRALRVRIIGGNPGQGKVLTSDATGLATWQNPAINTYTSGTGISIINSVVSNTGDLSTTNEIQHLSSTSSGTNRTINISGGNGTVLNIADNDNSAFNEIQQLILSGNTLSLTNGGGSIALPSSSAWSITGTNLHNTNTGNIGIGTNSPTSKLHVNGDAQANGRIFVNNANNEMSGTSNEFNIIRFGNATSRINLTSVAGDVNLTAGDDIRLTPVGDLQIDNLPMTSTATEALVIEGNIVKKQLITTGGSSFWTLDNGNVYRTTGNVVIGGIGSVSASQRLNINGSLSLTDDIFFDNDPNLRIESTSTSIKLRAQNNTNSDIEIFATDDIDLNADDDINLVSQSTINITAMNSASSDVDIQADDDIEFLAQDRIVLNTSAGELNIPHLFSHNSTSNSDRMVVIKSNGDLFTQSLPTGGSSIWNQAGNNIYLPSTSSKVGIGTSNPLGGLDARNANGPLIVPNLTASQAANHINSPNGSIIYLTTSGPSPFGQAHRFYFKENGSWVIK